MIPIVNNINKQFYKNAFFRGKVSFLTYKDIFPSFQVIKPIESIVYVKVDIYTVDDVFVQTFNNTNITLVDRSDTEHVVVANQVEIATPLNGDSLYYGKLTVGSKIYYTEVFKTTNNSRIVDIRITHDDDIRITHDSDRRITHG